MEITIKNLLKLFSEQTESIKITASQTSSKISKKPVTFLLLLTV